METSENRSDEGTVRSSYYPRGPYDLMWHSNAYGPYFGDIGLGIGLVKVTGNTAKGMPLCPAFLRLDPDKKQSFQEWRANSGNQAMPGVEPDVPIRPDLEIDHREWTPDALTSFYWLDGIAITQKTVVNQRGVHCSIRAESPVSLSFNGLSYGPCKVRRIEDGIHVVETSPIIRPREYTIRFAKNSDQVICDGTPLKPDDLRVSEDKLHWTFQWDDPVEEQEISVETARSFAAGPFPSFSTSGDNPFESPRPAFNVVAARVDEEWRTFFEQEVPSIECPDPRINELTQYLAWVSRSNAIHHGGLLPYPYSMAKHTFTAWWMWDSARSAIAASWHGPRELAWGGLLNTEVVQYPEPHVDAGVITNSSQWHGTDCWPSMDPAAPRFQSMPHVIPDEHGSGTHPPMFALGLWSIWSVDGRDDLMRRILPNALAYDRYFENNRRGERHPDLLVVRRWSDSGMDNSKRLGNYNTKGVYKGEVFPDADWEMPIVSVDVNVYSVVEKRCLARMCRATGNDDLASRLEAQADAREKALHAELWDDEKGFYFDKDDGNDRFTPIIAPTSMVPLMLDGIPADRIDKILEWLFDEDHFWTPYPIPSVSKSDRDFTPSAGYCRGPVWMSYTIDILRGLYNHRPAAAHRLFDRLAALMLKDGTPAIYECHNPMTGQGQECPNFCWNGQIVDVLLRNMFGVSWRNGKVIATSAGVPADWNQWAVRGVGIRGKRYDVRAERVDGQWRHEIKQS